MTKMNASRTSLEMIAPSVEEAIAKGLAELGLEEDEVDVDILDPGSRGLFGLGLRQARVRLSIKAQAGRDEAPVEDAPIEKPVSAPARMPAEEPAFTPPVSSKAEIKARPTPAVEAGAGVDDELLRVAR